MSIKPINHQSTITNQECHRAAEMRSVPFLLDCRLDSVHAMCQAAQADFGQGPGPLQNVHTTNRQSPVLQTISSLLIHSINIRWTICLTDSSDEFWSRMAENLDCE